MIIAILSWIYQLIVILPFGLVLIVGKKKDLGFQKMDSSFWIIAFLLGLAIVTTLSSIFSLFINIGWQVHGFILFSAILLWVYIIVGKRLPRIDVSFRPKSVLQKISLILLALAIVTLAVSSTASPSNSDTGLYHAQAIKWIETYKAVPGLANLHERFGYNSGWLVANALFSLSFLKFQSFHLLPSTLFLVCIIYFYGGIFNISGRNIKLSNLVRTAFFIASFLFLFLEISSPGTDFPVTLVIWVISSEWLKLIENEEDTIQKYSKWLVIIAFFCVTIKISSAPILIFVLWYIIRESKLKRFTRSILTVCIFGIFIFTPFISRNIIISGHLIYPGLSIDPIHTEWSVPSSVIEEEKYSIQWFALLPRVSKTDYDAMTWQRRYVGWFFDQLPRHKAILCYLGFIPVIWVFFLAFRRWRSWIKENKKYLWIVLTMYAGVIFWLASAPAFRFGYGFLLSAVITTGIPLVALILSQKNLFVTILQVAIILIGTGIGLKTMKRAFYPPLKDSQYILPLDYPILPTKQCEFGNFSMECATEWQACWYDPFPCATYSKPNVYMRGDDFSDGFMQKP